MTACVSTEGVPCSPSTSRMTPCASVFSSGYSMSSNTTLSPGFAFLACGSLMMTGLVRIEPSATTRYCEPCLSRFPV